MSYRLKIHAGAKADLRRIGRWIADYAGPDVARRKLDGIWGTLFALRGLPHWGNLQPDIGPGIRAVPSGEQAVVVFCAEDEAQCVTVKVLVVSYAGQDWGKRVKGRV